MFAMHKLFDVVSIPKEYFINQHRLFSEIELLIENNSTQEIKLDAYQIEELERLKDLILKAKIGKKFGEILDVWNKTSRTEVFNRNSNLNNSNPRLKFYQNIYINNKITDEILIKIQDGILNHYKKVVLFPMLLKKGVLELFNFDSSINLITALDLYKYAITRAKEFANNNHAKMTAEDNVVVLRELIYPLLLSKDLLNDEIYEAIKKNVNNLNPLDELKVLFATATTEEMDESIKGCEQIKSIILNNLDHLRRVQLIIQLLKQQQEKEKITFPMHKIFETLSIPKDYFINQRGLLADIELLIENNSTQEIKLDAYQIEELERLKNLILKAKIGQKFGEIIDLWNKTSKIPNALIKIQNCLSIYSKVMLFPTLFKNDILGLFSFDYSINLITALDLYDYVITLVKKAAKNDITKMTADDNFVVLREFLDPLLLSKDLLDNEIYEAIKNKVHQWYPKDELKELFPEATKEKIDEKINCCAQIQLIILNSLDDLRRFQFLKQQPVYKEYLNHFSKQTETMSLQRQQKFN